MANNTGQKKPSAPPPLSVITTEAQILADGVCELVICVPKPMADRLVSRACGQDLSRFIHDEVIRRAIESYVY